jgi:hypothetical protein
MTQSLQITETRLRQFRIICAVVAGRGGSIWVALDFCSTFYQEKVE